MFTCLHFTNSSLREISTLSFEKRMWYFPVRYSMHFLDPSSEQFDLSSIVHSRDVSVFPCLFSHTKLDSSVASFFFYFHISMNFYASTICLLYPVFSILEMYLCFHVCSPIQNWISQLRFFCFFFCFHIWMNFYAYTICSSKGFLLNRSSWGCHLYFLGLLLYKYILK